MHLTCCSPCEHCFSASVSAKTCTPCQVYRFAASASAEVGEVSPIATAKSVPPRTFADLAFEGQSLFPPVLPSKPAFVPASAICASVLNIIDLKFQQLCAQKRIVFCLLVVAAT